VEKPSQCRAKSEQVAVLLVVEARSGHVETLVREASGSQAVITVRGEARV
jgi:hypothetical protein